MKRKTFFLIAIPVVLLCVAAYGYREYHRTSEDLLHSKASARLKAADLIQAYENDSLSFHQNYLDQIIAVSGVLKKKDTLGNPVVLTLGETGNLSGVQCSMDSNHTDLYRSFMEGQTVTLKGLCTGARTEELFGTDIILNRCVAEQAYNNTKK